MLDSCFLCGAKKPNDGSGIFEKGDWYCNQRCRHGGRGLNTIDELISLLRDAFCDEPETMRRIKESVVRSLDAL